MRPPLRPLVKRLPSLLGPLSRRIGPHVGRWTPPNAETPAELRSVPQGIKRDPAAEEAAYREAPIGDFLNKHPMAFGWVFRRMWPTLLPILPDYYRARQRVAATLKIRPTSPPKLGSEELTALVKSEGTRLGMSAIGIAHFDPKYIFSEYLEAIPTGSVIVCVLEQNWAATQSIRSVRGERAAFATYIALMGQMNELAGVLHCLGHRAEVSTPEGRGVVIHYGVAAGLGQLGVNGQLLTPQAGSRTRIATIHTDAALVHDHPVDYGIEAICDACQVCVRRCPSGAIPGRRSEFRGVVKNKLKAERCMPVVPQADGCAICMKVCPIQRYGLDAVKETYMKTGKVLGKDTDELEAYHWPLDGRTYGVNQKPRIDKTTISPPGWKF
jgi:epoxyqueuosine reductase